MEPFQTQLNDIREIDIEPNQRFANVGKTRSGKTLLAIALASILVPNNSKDWEAWWVETKHDPKDIRVLHDWGFKTDKPKTNRHPLTNLWQPDKPSGPRKLFILNGDIHQECEALCKRALQTGGVLLIIDEYVHVVKSSQNAGTELTNVFERGGGVDVGVIGLTQEPVYVPRQLLSQATHQFLHNVSYPLDIQYLQSMYPDYIRPTKLPVFKPEEWGHTKRTDHTHGFYHIAVDYDGEGAYFLNQYQWAKTVIGREPVAK